MKDSGESAASVASKRTTYTRSTPARQASSLVRSEESRGGADSWREEFARMRLEGHHRRRQREILAASMSRASMA